MYTQTTAMSPIETKTATNAECYDPDHIPSQTLWDIVRIQTKIVQMGLDLSGIIALISQEVQNLTDAAGAIIELVENEEMVYRAATGIARPQLGLRISKDSSFSGLCINTGIILSCSDTQYDHRIDKVSCQKIGFRSMLVAPLIHNNTAVGVLKIVSPQPYYFNERHIAILGTMSELIAASMYYSSKYELGDLHFRATHDVMTGLANRALYYDQLRRCFSMASRHEEHFGVLNIDMDGLKTINDTYGHRVGDVALRELAARIKRSARESDIVARIGGDEFGVLLSRLEGRNGAKNVAQRISDEIHKPFVFENKKISLRASIGLAIYPDDASDMETILEKADRAMYRSKRRRKQIAKLH